MPPSPTVQIRGKFLYNCFSDSVPKPSKNSGRRFFDVFRRHLWRESPLGVSRHLRESHSHHQVCQSGEGTTRGWRMFCVFLVFLRSFRMIKGDDGEFFFFFAGDIVKQIRMLVSPVHLEGLPYCWITVVAWIKKDEFVKATMSYVALPRSCFSGKWLDCVVRRKGTCLGLWTYFWEGNYQATSQGGNMTRLLSSS